MSLHGLLLICCVASAAVILSLPARGEEPAQASSAAATAPPATVAEHIARGDRLRKAGLWADAAAAYRAAWALDKQPGVAAELGLCELALGRFRDAAELLEVGRMSPGALTGEQLERVREGHERATREVVTAFIAVDPPDATVLLDGKPIGAPSRGQPFFVEPGAHTVRGRLPGYREAWKTFEAGRGSTQIISLHLGEELDTPAPAPAPPAASRASGGAPAPPAAEGAIGPTLRRVGLGVTAGTAALGIGLAAAMGVVDGDLRDQARALQEEAGRSGCVMAPRPAGCEGLAGQLAVRDALAAGSIVSFVLSGVVGAVTLSSLGWAPSPSSRPASPRQGIQVLPLWTGQAGLSLRAAW